MRTVYTIKRRLSGAGAWIFGGKVAAGPGLYFDFSGFIFQFPEC